MTQYRCDRGIQVVFNSTLHSTLSLPVCVTMSIVLEPRKSSASNMESIQWHTMQRFECVFFNNVENSFRPMICTSCAMLQPNCDERISFWIPRKLASVLFIQIPALEHSSPWPMMSEVFPVFRTSPDEFTCKCSRSIRRTLAFAQCALTFSLSFHRRQLVD